MTAEEASKLLSNRVLMSRRAFPEAITRKDLLAMEIPPGTVIRNSCFSCEVPDSEVFPPKMRGVRFVGCNLDNVLLPPGNPDLGENDRCSQRRFAVNPADTEKRDWTLGSDGRFVAPITSLSEVREEQ